MSGAAHKADYLRDVSEIACADKRRLLKEYEETTQAFSKSVTELNQLRGTSPVSEYARLQRATDEARINSEQARLALEEHISKHRC
jgi:hypothetical protein